jgi:hypothetical protein
MVKRFMDSPSSSTRDLARRLLALEAASKGASRAHEHEAVRVCDKLQVSMTRFVGADGFTSLLRRALALARADVPSLQSVKLNSDGSLDGLDLVTANAATGGAEAAMAITTHLLGLLVTFIVEPLTLRLVRDVWAEASLDD